MNAVSTLTKPEIGRLLRKGAFALATGPFVVRIKSDIDLLTDAIADTYRHTPCVVEPEFSDFHVELTRCTGLRRWARPQITFMMDGVAPFLPLPLAQAFALFEWGLNWCVASHAHRYLILHAAVLARGSNAVILPAPPGSGKSTLTAALSHRGWRLMSDELTLIDPVSRRIRALARPISLKNESISVVSRLLPEGRLGMQIPDTKKGTIAFLTPPQSAIDSVREEAVARWIITPRYTAGARTTLTPVTRPETLNTLIANSFNYNVHGSSGFEAFCRIAADTTAFEFEYSRMDEALATFESLATGLN